MDQALKTYRPILIIGVLEILIGGLALLTNLITLSVAANHKSPNVLLFVMVTGIISILIGLGLLKFSKTAYQLLIYFSSVIILSKVLILMGIFQLNGSFETVFPSPLRSCISIVYHSFVIFYLMQKDVREIFLK